jgi:hypothetical protein
VGLDIHPREAMAGTGNDFEELGDGVKEIENLGNEQQEKSFAEVPVDSDHRKGHPREITKGIPDKHRGRVPIEFQEAKSHSEERDNQDEREDLALPIAEEIEIIEFEEEDAAADDIRLPRLKAIDA